MLKLLLITIFRKHNYILKDKSLICDKSVTTQNWAFLSYWYRKNICGRAFNRYSVVTQFAKLAAGERLCRRCTRRILQHFKTFINISPEKSQILRRDAVVVNEQYTASARHFINCKGYITQCQYAITTPIYSVGSVKVIMWHIINTGLLLKYFASEHLAIVQSIKVSSSHKSANVYLICYYKGQRLCEMVLSCCLINFTGK
jgi:hypothetical protein